MQKLLRLQGMRILLFMFVLSMAACGGGGGGDSTSPPPVIPVAKPLAVVTTEFPDGSPGVDPRKKNFVFGFSAPLGPAGLPLDLVQLSDGTTPVPVSVSYVGAVATVTTTTPLKPRTSYRLTLKSGLASDNGGTLKSDFVFSFRTAFAVFESKLMAPKQPLGNSVSRIKLADLNGDGRLDVIVLTDITRTQEENISGYTISVFQQNAAGGLDVTQRFSHITGPLLDYSHYFPDNVFAIDLDDDGRPELLVPESNISHEAQSGIRVFKAGADGQFAPLRFISTPYVQRIDAFDIDGDGRQDLVGIANRTEFGPVPYGFQVLRNTGKELELHAPIALPIGAYWFGVGDFDNDGKPELLVNRLSTDSNGSNLRYLLSFYSQKTPGDFTLNQGLTQANVNDCFGAEVDHYCTNFYVLDANGDGLPDIAFGNGVMFYNQAAGGLLHSTRAPGLVFGNADFDRDGVQDLLLTGVGSTVYISVAAGTKGSNSLELSSAFGVQGPNYPLIPDFAIGDINGDGRPDVLVYDENFGVIALIQVPL